LFTSEIEKTLNITEANKQLVMEMPGNRALAMFALAALLLAMPAAMAQVPPEAIEPLAQPAEEQIEEQAEGEVSAVDVENNTITVSTADGEELVLNVTESTRVTKEGIEELGMSSLEQIAEGDSVLVTYNLESMELISIDVLPAEETLPTPDQPVPGGDVLPEEEPIEEPAPELPEEPVEQTPGFEAYLALGAIGLAGAAVALTHRKKKE
jgi:hypothetical protein